MVGGAGGVGAVLSVLCGRSMPAARERFHTVAKAASTRFSNLPNSIDVDDPVEVSFLFDDQVIDSIAYRRVVYKALAPDPSPPVPSAPSRPSTPDPQPAASLASSITAAPVLDRWAQIRQRAAKRGKVVQSRAGTTQDNSSNNLGADSESIETRVARIRTRVAELVKDVPKSTATATTTPPTAVRSGAGETDDKDGDDLSGDGESKSSHLQEAGWGVC
ncbi:hypothetical protein EDC01DRAFT_665493 [Geopyxis carbonaria]|nr:hypothetical protein EDC01DRAFT_665493 [Geopyxis carbonaria]